MLMGEDVGPRREFIEQNATFAQIDAWAGSSPIYIMYNPAPESSFLKGGIKCIVRD